MRPVGFFAAAVIFGVLGCATTLAAGPTAPGSMPPAPKVSTFAPAEDLDRQVDQYIKELDAVVADEAEYKDGQDKIAKDSNTLIIVALALGLHDGRSKYKPHAAALMEAARAVAAAKDLDSARKTVAALREAADGRIKTTGEISPRWEKVASLPELMKQVPIVNTKLKRYVKGPKFKKKAKETAGYTAVIAAIAQGAMADTSATKTPEQIQQWYGLSAAMRDAAGAVNVAIHKGDEPAATAAMKKLAQSCDDCHVVFHPKALEVTKE